MVIPRKLKPVIVRKSTLVQTAFFVARAQNCISKSSISSRGNACRWVVSSVVFVVSFCPKPLFGFCAQIWRVDSPQWIRYTFKFCLSVTVHCVGPFLWRSRPSSTRHSFIKHKGTGLYLEICLIYSYGTLKFTVTVYGRDHILGLYLVKEWMLLLSTNRKSHMGSLRERI